MSAVRTVKTPLPLEGSLNCPKAPIGTVQSLAHSVAPVGANYGNAIIISLSPNRDGPVCLPRLRPIKFVEKTKQCHPFFAKDSPRRAASWPLPQSVLIQEDKQGRPYWDSTI